MYVGLDSIPSTDFKIYLPSLKIRKFLPTKTERLQRDAEDEHIYALPDALAIRVYSFMKSYLFALTRFNSSLHSILTLYALMGLAGCMQKPAEMGPLVLKAQHVIVTLIPSDLSAISIDF